MAEVGARNLRVVEGSGTDSEDLVEEYVGTVRDSTHVTRSAARS